MDADVSPTDIPDYCAACGRALPSPDAGVCNHCGALVSPNPSRALATPPHFYATAAPPPRMKGTGTARILFGVVVILVVFTVVGVALAVNLSGPGGLTGFRILAPATGCWHGGLGDPGNLTTVQGCGAEDVQTACAGFLSASLLKDDNATWTLTVEVLVNGHVAGEESTRDPAGGVSVFAAC